MKELYYITIKYKSSYNSQTKTVEGTTYAVSEEQAINNILYRCKQNKIYIHTCKAYIRNRVFTYRYGEHIKEER